MKNPARKRQLAAVAEVVWQLWYAFHSAGCEFPIWGEGPFMRRLVLAELAHSLHVTEEDADHVMQEVEAAKASTEPIEIAELMKRWTQYLHRRGVLDASEIDRGEDKQRPRRMTPHQHKSFDRREIEVNLASY